MNKKRIKQVILFVVLVLSVGLCCVACHKEVERDSAVSPSATATSTPKPFGTIGDLPEDEFTTPDTTESTVPSANPTESAQPTASSGSVSTVAPTQTPKVTSAVPSASPTASPKPTKTPSPTATPKSTGGIFLPADRL